MRQLSLCQYRSTPNRDLLKFGGYDGQQHEFELDRVRWQLTSPEGSW